MIIRICPDHESFYHFSNKERKILFAQEIRNLHFARPIFGSRREARGMLLAGAFCGLYKSGTAMRYTQKYLGV